MFCALNMPDCVCFRALNMPDCVCSCVCAFDVCLSCVVLSLCAALMVKHFFLLRQNITGWCSWCFEETTQVLWCSLPLPLRSIHQCSYCRKFTARCQRCPDGFARSHADWCDVQCAVCSGVLDCWGMLPAINGKARIRKWCSGCMRHSVHDLEQLRFFLASVYRCSNCH